LERKRHIRSIPINRVIYLSDVFLFAFIEEVLSERAAEHPLMTELLDTRKRARERRCLLDNPD
jgi:hypothetical protein